MSPCRVKTDGSQMWQALQMYIHTWWLQSRDEMPHSVENLPGGKCWKQHTQGGHNDLRLQGGTDITGMQISKAQRWRVNGSPLPPEARRGPSQR